jgi:hypothetical protein
MSNPTAPPQQGDWRLEKLRTLAHQYEIKPEFVQKLRQLESFEIVLICDDSGSMGTIIDDGNSSDPFGKKMTRWDELCSTVSIVAEIASALDPTGCDVYFLNRAPMRNITSSSQVQVAFQYPPAGYTPTSRVMRQVLKEKEGILKEKNLLLILGKE